jgi:valyl-tRNA synthetase
MGDVPFREVYIHGLVRDQDGQKMSKSKGNILDPIDLIDGIDLEGLLEKRTAGLMQTHLQERIEKATRKEFPDGIPAFGADALRFTFASLATTGRDVRFDLARVDGYHRFCNKLWNAAAYVHTQLGDGDGDLAGERELGVADRWIRSRLADTVATVHGHYAEYRLDLVSSALYDFAWHEYCDWYLELTKPVLNDDGASPAAKRAARATLAEVLGALL